MREVTIKNTGPIEFVRIPIPEKGRGGVILFKGPHGVGKSTGVDSVDALATGRDVKDLSPKDGTARGVVEGLGVKISIGQRNTRTGELECTGIESKVSIDKIVDPGIIDPEKADNERMRHLVTLAKVPADPKLFIPLFKDEEEFKALIKLEELGGADNILSMADCFKRAVQKLALGFEGKSNTEAALAASCLAQTEGVDVEAESNSAVLQSKFEEAVRLEQKVNSEKKAADDKQTEITNARAKLAEASETDAGKRLADCKRSEEEASASLTTWTARAADLETQVKELQVQLEAAYTYKANAFAALKAAQASVTTAQEYANTLVEWEKTLAEAATAAIPPAPEYMDAVADVVTKARDAVEQGAVIRLAKAKLVERDNHHVLMKEYTERAASLRGVAAGVDGVLSEQIAKLGGTLRVEKGRLVTTTDRGTEFYSDLSDGERWKLAIDVVIEALGPDGILTAPQWCWDGFNQSFRDEIYWHLVERSAVLVTAQVTDDGALSAEEYQPSKPR